MAELTAKKRNKLKRKQFAIPDERAYPINDRSHAANALARVEQHGTPAEKRKVRRAVAKKYGDHDDDQTTAKAETHNKPPALPDQPAVPKPHKDDCVCKAVELSGEDGEQLFKAMEDGEVATYDGEWVIKSGDQLLKAADRSPVDYWRTIRGVRTPFTGSPGHGTAVGGHPGIMAAANKRSRADKQVSEGGAIDPKKRYTIWRRDRHGAWQQGESAHGHSFLEGGKNAALLGDRNVKVTVRRARHGGHPVKEAAVGKSIVDLSGPDSLVKAQAMEPGDIGELNGELVLRGEDGLFKSVTVDTGRPPKLPRGYDPEGVTRPGKRKKKRGKGIVKSAVPAVTAAAAYEHHHKDKGPAKASASTIHDKMHTPTEHGASGTHGNAGAPKKEGFWSKVQHFMSKAGVDCEYDGEKDMEKAEGEGGRGGHVIGHTKTGKAIYAQATMANAGHLASYSRQDHLDAAAVHRKAGNEQAARGHEQRAQEKQGIARDVVQHVKEGLHRTANFLHGKSIDEDTVLDLVKSEFTADSVRVGAVTYTSAPDYTEQVSHSTKPYRMRQRRE